mmetsp:Transcript_41960/g.106724  ORF Transcript_41960/g.106724 Transcript_41960/m.106724 type:complete len:276 (+) Transcript_41960:81-908(+)
MARIVVASLLVLSLGAFGEAAKVTPVEKVISLLGKLQVQVEQEGKAEAAAYDKYACFCKEEVSDKQYAIEKSTAKIAKLDEKINLLGSEITALDGEIAELTKKIAGMDKDMKDAQEKWDIEHKVFLAAQADMAGAIQACESALKVLKTSRGARGGDTELMEKEPFDVWKPNTYGNITMVDVKKYGAAGTLAYVFTELAFWALAVPTECAVFYQTAGRWPDFSNDMDKAAVVGFVFAASNIARLCLPLRFGAALAMAPWVDANIMKRFQGSVVVDS